MNHHGDTINSGVRCPLWTKVVTTLIFRIFCQLSSGREWDHGINNGNMKMMEQSEFCCHSYRHTILLLYVSLKLYQSLCRCFRTFPSNRLNWFGTVYSTFWGYFCFFIINQLRNCSTAKRKCKTQGELLIVLPFTWRTYCTLRKPSWFQPGKRCFN